MGYTIYHKAMFLKVGEKYLPMFETAESNVWSYENPRKRTRDWGNTRFSVQNFSFLMSENDLLNIPLETEKRIMAKNSDYKKDSFGYYLGIAIGSKKTNKSSFNDYKNLFKSGIKNSITFDIMNKLNIQLKAVKFDLNANKYVHIDVKSEDELINLIENEKDIWLSYYYMNDSKYDYIKLILNNKPYKPKYNRVPYGVETNLGFVIGFDDNFKPKFTKEQELLKRFTENQSKIISNIILNLNIEGLHSVSYFPILW